MVNVLSGLYVDDLNYSFLCKLDSSNQALNTEISLVLPST